MNSSPRLKFSSFMRRTPKVTTVTTPTVTTERRRRSALMEETPAQQIVEKKEEPKPVKKVKLEVTVKETSYDIYECGTKSLGRLCSVYPSPTNNCQIQSISGIDYVLANLNTEDTITFLHEVYENTAMKTLFLVDVSSPYLKRIEAIFEPSEMLVKAPYINNTGSSMCLYLLQIKQMLERRDLI